jgi:50S ribosomal subunit-associated GTPase HflX
VVLVYDTVNRSTFRQLAEFIQDVRSLTSPQVTMVACGNKADLIEEADRTWIVPPAEVRTFSQSNPDITVTTCSAKSGKGIEDLFDKVAAQLLTKIELGEIDPEDMNSGVQYGDVPRWDRSTKKSRKKDSKKGFSALSRFFANRAGEEEIKKDQQDKEESGGRSSSRKNSNTPLLRRPSTVEQEPIELDGRGADSRVDVAQQTKSGCCY